MIDAQPPGSTAGQPGNFFKRSAFEQFDLIQRETEKTFVESYSPMSYTIGGVSLYGGVILLPKHFFMWRMNEWKQVTIESLSIFEMIHPTPDIVLLGCGTVFEFIPDEIREYFRKRRIGIESMSSFHAISTFNVLNMEDRNVAAAVLPNTPFDPAQLTPEKTPGVFKSILKGNRPEDHFGWGFSGR